MSMKNYHLRIKKVLVYIIGDANPEISISYWDRKAEKPDDEGFLFINWYYQGEPMYKTSWYQKVTHWVDLPGGPENV
jgi:hypothetical protein